MNSHLETKLAGYKSLVQSRLASLIDKSEPSSLYDPMRYALAQPGKQLRPSLLMLSCEAVGGAAEKALDTALAIEVIHTFTLVHDDIMDHDELRRGRQTVHRRWDENIAILAGDGLLVLGYSLLSRVDSSHLPVILSIFSTAILEICEGQSMDKEFESRSEISLDDYYHMIEKKTGRLFALACEAGALLGDGDTQQVAALKRFGAEIGRAFQLQDDLLDVLGDQKTIGKNVGSDLEEDKKTFLITHARHFSTPLQRKKLADLTAFKPISADGLLSIISLFEEIGSIPAAKIEIRRSLESARSALELLPANAARSSLDEFLDALSLRSF